MKTLRLLDLYGIPYNKEYDKINNFYEDIINIKQNENIKKKIKIITNYYKKRKSNKEEYLLAYN